MFLWGQSCLLPYDLRYQDSIWIESQRTWSALGKISHLRDARSNLPVKVRSLSRTSTLTLLSVCEDHGKLRWQVRWKEDTLLWISERLPVRWLTRHLTLLRGVRTWYPDHPPYKQIEVLIPLSERPLLSHDTLWRYNEIWLDSFALPWMRTLRLKTGRLTALGLKGRYFSTGKIVYEAISLYLHPHTELPFDEKVYEVRLSRLPRPYRAQLNKLLHTNEAYAYVVRIQDYYPETVEEAITWLVYLMEGRSLPLPAYLSIDLSSVLHRLIKGSE